MSQIVYLSNVTLSFPHIENAADFNGNGIFKFSADFIMNEKDKSFSDFMKVYQSLALEKWKDKAKAVMASLLEERKKRCFGKGTEKKNSETLEVLDGYSDEGAVYIHANNTKRPQIVGADGKSIDPSNSLALAEEYTKLYGGAKVNAAVKPWLQDNDFGKGIRCNLIAVQFLKDGTPFGEPTEDVSTFFKANAESGMPALPDFLK